MRIPILALSSQILAGLDWHFLHITFVLPHLFNTCSLVWKTKIQLHQCQVVIIPYLLFPSLRTNLSKHTSIISHLSCFVEMNPMLQSPLKTSSSYQINAPISFITTMCAYAGMHLFLLIPNNDSKKKILWYWIFRAGRVETLWELDNINIQKVIFCFRELVLLELTKSTWRIKGKHWISKSVGKQYHILICTNSWEVLKGNQISITANRCWFEKKDSDHATNNVARRSNV